MRKILPILFLISSCSSSTNKADNLIKQIDSLTQKTMPSKLISDSTNTLTGKIENLEFSYIVWGCACANWVTQADFDKYQYNGLSKHCIFIEPANDSLELPLFFDASRHIIKIKGQFYTKPDYPKEMTQTEEHSEKAKVFYYTGLEVKENKIQYSHKDDQTLTLNYNAIACSCAQWSESKYNDNPDKREFLYLERGDNKLVDADTLYNGENFPIQIG